MKPASNRPTLSRKANWSERARYYLVREIARSCNITDFYPQGTVKAIVYRTRVDWRQELIERIDGAHSLIRSKISMKFGERQTQFPYDAKLTLEKGTAFWNGRINQLSFRCNKTFEGICSRFIFFFFLLVQRVLVKLDRLNLLHSVYRVTRFNRRAQISCELCIIRKSVSKRNLVCLEEEFSATVRNLI